MRSTPKPQRHTVKYEVDAGASSTGPASSITYSNAGGDTAQAAKVDLPWSYTRQAVPGDFLYVSAQNGSQFGFIQCRILVDGKKVKETRSEGGYVIATCSMSAP